MMTSSGAAARMAAMSDSFSRTPLALDTVTLHGKIGWTQAEGKTSAQPFWETQTRTGFTWDFTSGVPAISSGASSHDQCGRTPEAMGPQLQRLTTREPDLAQLAVAIAALEAVLAVENPEEASEEDKVGMEVVA